MNLPRLSNNGSTPYNPKNFIATWAATMSAVEGGLNNGASDGGALLEDVLRAGRVADTDFFTTDAGQPSVPPSPALAVLLQNGVWFVQGQRVVIDEPEPLSGLLIPAPANQPDGVYGYVSVLDVDTGDGIEPSLEITPEHWDGALHPEWSAAGYACIGLVKTDDSHVLSIEPVVDGAYVADVIPPWPALLRKILTLAAPGGGGGDVTQAMLDAAVDALNARIDALRDELGGNVTGVTNDSPFLAVNVARLIGTAVDLNPETAPRFIAAINMPHATGHGQLWGDGAAPLVMVGKSSNAVVDYETGVLR